MKLPSVLERAAADAMRGALVSALVLGTVVAPPEAIAATDGAAIGKCLLRKCQ